MCFASRLVIKAKLCYNTITMSRLHQWDYKKPFYYLVTLKRLPNLPPLAILKPDDPFGFDKGYPITVALQETLHRFVVRSPGIAGIAPYAIMPDHIHLLIKLNDHPARKSLIDYVDMLKRLLRNAFQKVYGKQVPLFENEWHDLICMKANQLANFQNYILDNPKMALLRQSCREKFHCYRGQHHWRLGATACDFVGNPELLNEPALLAVKISRRVLPGTPEWQKAESFYGRWRVGATAVGTWWSKGEQMAYQKILAAGGNIIVLSPDGFGERWHPAGEQAQELCAQGRLLFISPYKPHAAHLPVGETRARCVALNDFAKALAIRRLER